MRKPLFSGPLGAAWLWAAMVASERGWFGERAEPPRSQSAGLLIGCSAADFWDAAGAAVHACLGGSWESACFELEEWA